MKHIALAIVFAFAPFLAQAATVDFEDRPGVNGGLNEQSGGFNFEFNASGWALGDLSALGGLYNQNGTNILIASGDRNGNARVEMTKIDNGAFDLTSLSIATAIVGTTNTLDILGTLLGGGTVSASFATSSTAQTVFLSGFTNMSSVLFSSGTSGPFREPGLLLDNLATAPVSAIPLPAGGTLLLIGLGAFGIMSRRRRVA